MLHEKKQIKLEVVVVASALDDI